ncbi:putative S-adenosyl-L-methionine-dependent methyltransferase [Nocardia nova SH22a]|uniref:S-adenosyl-L-methionine-dependent methyltransferase n=1 Tax=Nocardia nova SH22a TaxID=1415166 RepID=W5TRD7_9NOCA|nr:class I SAM-dependent methyltransferase [Nocardia nova]AHH21488.1 putative S-adenosyl-L-methionine-dependent methyltransferase [Nocardia nova SH22a]
MTSSRHDGDVWDLASSVGATATMSAAVRAIASRDGRITDTLAEPLVRAVGIEHLTRLATGDVSHHDSVDRIWIDMAEVRTEFYDQFFLDAANAGIAQAVILASGLDSRAFRLPWPAGTVVYEVDQPRVIEFKSRALAELGVTPTAERRTAAADLRDDWPAALRAAGFDPARPTAWSAEGLLGYLPPGAQDHLLDTITTLSAPGSRIATESRPNPGPGDDAETKEGLERIEGRWRSEGFDTDMSALRYYGERNEAGPYLGGRGWSVSGSTVRELFSDKGFQSLQDDGMHMGDMAYVSGVLSASCSPRA